MFVTKMVKTRVSKLFSLSVLTRNRKLHNLLECKTLSLVSVVPRFLTGSHGHGGKTHLVLHKYHSPTPSKLSHRRKVCFATFKGEPVVKTFPISFVFLLLDTDVNVSCIYPAIADPNERRCNVSLCCLLSFLLLR